MDNRLPTLLTIGPSHYCEKARWALDYLNIEYQEEICTPIFNMIHNRKYKAKTLPILLIDDLILKDSTDILQYLDKKTGYGTLYPIDGDEKKQVEELEDLFDKDLGTHTRRWAYFYILEREDLMIDIFCLGANPLEEAIFQTFFPIVKYMFKASMRINVQGAERSRSKIEQVFEKVENLLSDGRKYLTGDKITAADITFSSLALPIILPNGYSFRQGDKANLSDDDLNREMEVVEEKIYWIDRVPTIMADEVRAFRETKAGKFALEMYKNHRHQSILKN